MIEFLAAIEPASIPLLAVMAFALSLYPVGLMLGSPCSPCCGCSACLQGALPSTVTVTLSGMPDTRPGPDLLIVSINSCFGFGATAEARAPSGDAGPGPITSIEVTNGGSGYAKLGQIEPVVTAEGVGGVDAELTVTLTEDEDLCGLPFWAVTAIGITDGGSGYSLNSEIVFTPAEGDVEDQAAVAQVSETDAGEPTLSLSGPEDRGSGAEFTAVLNQVGFAPDPERWEISSVTVDEGGTGYFDGDQLTVDEVDGTIEAVQAYMIIRTVRDEPVLTITPRNGSDLVVVVRTLGVSPALATWEIDEVTVNDGGSGYVDREALTLSYADNVRVDLFSLLVARTIRSEPTLTATTSSGDGAVFTIALSQSGSPPVWSASSVTVTNPGSGYTNGATWTITASLGTRVFFGSATAAVDESGGLLSLTIDSGGEFFFDTGEIDFVEVQYRGVFFEDTGVIESIEIPFGGGSYYETTGAILAVTISSGGEYYREDDSIPALVDDVTVEVFDGAPSNGAGATFEAVIDDDPDSATFGQITAITVTSGGDDYLEFLNIQVCCGEFYNGRPIVLRRGGAVAEPGEAQLGTYTIGGAFPSGSFPGPYRCVYEHRSCGVGNNFRKRGFLAVNYSGAGNPITIQLLAEKFASSSDPPNFFECFAGSSFENSDDFLSFSSGIENCSEFSFSATNENGVTVTVAPGGDYDPDDGYAGLDSCHICCQGLDEVPAEILTSWVPAEGAAFVAPAGDYVLVKDFALNINTIARSTDGEIQWASSIQDLAIRIKTCYSGLNGNGVSPDLSETPADCGDCYRSCAVFAFTNGPTFGSIVASQANCNSCAPVPVCYPPAGAYVIPERGTLTVQ